MSQLPMASRARAAEPAGPTAVHDEALARPDEAAALVTARLTGKRVQITGLTSETDEAWANPNGTVSWEHRYRPVRVDRDGGWVPVDTTLVVRPDGMVAPRAAAVDVAFSGGGWAPLVRLADDGDRLALGSPLGALPAPVLAGDMATYPEVLPGVDLQVRADVDGFAQVLVVKDRAAAANPKLDRLVFKTASAGLAVKADQAGNLDVVDASDGSQAFAGNTPLMWDADAEPATAETGAPASSVITDPDADQVTMPVAVSSAQLVVTPNQQMLADPDTTFPVYIDPGFTAYRSAWTMVDSAYPTTSYWNSAEDAQIGTWNGGANKRRSFFNLNVAGSPMAGKHVISATLNLYEKWAWSCTARQFHLYSTSVATSASTWNNQPSWASLQSSATVAKGYSASCPAGTVQLDATPNAQAAATGGWSNMTLGIRAGSETDNTYWKRFSNNPTLSVTYTAYPTVGTRGTVPATTCATGAARPYLNTTTPQLRAQINDPEGAAVRPEFEWAAAGGARIGGAQPTPGQVSGATFAATVPAGQLAHGGSYAWRVRGYDSTVWGSWSTLCEFTVDTAKPAAAPTVTSTAYPKDQWAGQAGTAGTFTLGSAGVSDVAAYLYGLDIDPPTTAMTAPALGGPATVTITPGSDGPHTLYVYARDRAGNLSPVTAYPFNVGSGAVTGPDTGDLSAGTTALEGVGQTHATGITYQWRRADADPWSTIPTTDVTVAAGGAAVTWPVPTTGGGEFPKLNWNLAKTVNDAEAGPDPLDGPLQVQAVFTGGTSGTSSAVRFSLDRDRAAAASTQIGPGSVNLVTGNLAIAESDASVDSYGSDLTVSRTYNSRQPGALDPMFGPGWVSSAGVEAAGAPYTGLTVTGSLVQVGLPDGDSIGFTRKASTATGASFVAELGVEDLTLAYTTAGDQYALTDLDGTVVTFSRPAGTPAGRYLPTKVATAGSGQITAVSWEKATVDGVDVMRPTQMLAPVPAGVTCEPSLGKGCRALSFSYATTTTATGSDQPAWGDYAGRLAQVAFTAFNPATNAMATVVLARYSYDPTGRLRAAWDPRLDFGGGQHLADTYTYDPAGLLTGLRPAGREPWQLAYTTIPGDSGVGRLYQVTRSALDAGTATSTVVYGVPTSGPGAPHDLSVGRTRRWGQTEAPVIGAAVYGPDQIPDGTPATGVLPGSYERAYLIYTDANGRIVNTVAPGGYSTATWYDRWGNTARTITAGNLQRTLDASDSDTPEAEAQLAAQLSTINLYSTDGQQLRETLSPEHELTLPEGTLVRGRAHTVTRYDETATGDGPYQLPTTQITSVRYTDTDGTPVDADARTTTTAYNWDLRQPTAVTVDPTGLNLTTRTSYDPATGLVTSTTTPAGGTSDTTPATRRLIYYRAGTGSGHPECDHQPQWTNLVCRVQPGGQPSTGPELPATVTTYDMFNQPTTIVEKTSAEVLRTTTVRYDAAARVHEVSVSAAGLGEQVPTRRTVYDPATGRPVRTQTIDATGAITAQIVRGYDALGRQISYTDADGNTATTSYDLAGRSATTSDGKATRIYTYDAGTERRGLLTGVSDSVAGQFTANHDADGAVVGETWPNGVAVTHTRDEAGNDTGLTYERPGCGQPDCTVYSALTGANVHGQQRRTSSTLATHTYSYDPAGRLTTVTDTTDGACTTSTYTFSTATNRTNHTSYQPAADGGCQTSTPTASTSHTYDSADRITGGYTYDPLGRTTTLPAAHTANPAGGNLTIGYHTTDLVKTITQAGRTTNYTLDVTGERIRTWTDNTNGTEITRRHHYDNDTDSPAWTDEGNGTWTAPITGATGMAGTRTATGIDWHITNPHGDLVATIHHTDSGITATHTANEYGTPHNPADIGGRRYGWLGSKQRAADTPTGIVLMGVRLYNTTTGRFLQVDPVYGGSCNPYEYTCADPINNVDLDGRRLDPGDGGGSGGNTCVCTKQNKKWRHYKTGTWVVGPWTGSWWNDIPKRVRNVLKEIISGFAAGGLVGVDEVWHQFRKRTKIDRRCRNGRWEYRSEKEEQERWRANLDIRFWGEQTLTSRWGSPPTG